MYAIVDIETTGSQFGEDRITEVAVWLHDGSSVTGSWQQLVDPERPIPPFISRLTGIDDDTVAGAPVFEHIADELMQQLKGRIFIAHNVGFDYHFLRREFERAGVNFKAERLCTVRLARKVFPGMASYSLGKLCTELGIELTDRHRAFGDARATAELFTRILSADRKGHVAQMLKRGTGERNLPANLPAATYTALPEAPGVYYFHNGKGQVIYVGKAKNIKRRVASHFANAERNGKAANMRHCIHDVSCEETGSELIALLLESYEIKRHDPVFNAAQKQWFVNYALISYSDRNDYQRLAVERFDRRKPVVLTFSGMLAARNYLLQMVREHRLCAKLCGLQRAAGPCTEHLVGACGGACKGSETPSAYNDRVKSALRSVEKEYRNVLVLGPGRSPDERSVVAVQNGHYLGFGYYDPDQVSEDPEALRDQVSSQPDNGDTQRIMQAYLRSAHRDRVIDLDRLHVS